MNLLQAPDADGVADPRGDGVGGGAGARTALVDGAAGEFGDLQNGIYLNGDAIQLAILFQRSDEVARISTGRTMSVAPAVYTAGVLRSPNTGTNIAVGSFL